MFLRVCYFYLQTKFISLHFPAITKVYLHKMQFKTSREMENVVQQKGLLRNNH